MSELSERQMDRYLRGELSPAESRELAQASLSDDELFDALAAHGAVEQSLEDPAFRAAVEAPKRGKLLPFPGRTWTAAVAIAAAVVAIAIYLRSSRQAPPAQAITASLDPTAGKPTLLAENLGPVSSAAAPVFRSSGSDSRAPQPEGTIVATDNFLATVNLGSLDGLAKGMQLDVFRGESKQPAGRLEMTTIFRDRARGRIISRSSIQTGDRVRAAPSVYLGAVLEEMNSNQGDARKIAREALAWAASSGVAASDTRKIEERLAPMEYRAGDVKAAIEIYQSLLASAATQTERDAALNDWGALLLLGGDTAQAESKFRETHDALGLNNLGVSAELRGDTAAARAFYQQALGALDNSGSSARDRQIVEANLARLARGAHEQR